MTSRQLVVKRELLTGKGEKGAGFTVTQIRNLGQMDKTVFDQVRGSKNEFPFFLPQSNKYIKTNILAAFSSGWVQLQYL